MSRPTEKVVGETQEVCAISAEAAPGVVEVRMQEGQWHGYPHMLTPVGPGAGRAGGGRADG